MELVTMITRVLPAPLCGVHTEQVGEITGSIEKNIQRSVHLCLSMLQQFSSMFEIILCNLTFSRTAPEGWDPNRGFITSKCDYCGKTPVDGIQACAACRGAFYCRYVYVYV